MARSSFGSNSTVPGVTAKTNQVPVDKAPEKRDAAGTHHAYAP
ncbi:MAG: hypothetical protein AAF685_00050 [Cyanobacteria bacterium P01_C01_bin.89]